MGLVVGIALLLAALAKHARLSVAAPVLLAVAAGMLYGLQDALTRISGQRLSRGGWPELMASWQPYAVIALGVSGLVLVQSAFETAPLRMSLPALTAAQPLAGIACAVGFLGDRLRTDTGALAWEAAGLAAIVAGIVLLGLHPRCRRAARPRRRPATFSRTERPRARRRRGLRAAGCGRVLSWAHESG